MKPPRTIEGENFGTIACDKKFLGAYDGTIDITKGTGRYRGVKGTGTLKGGSPDAIKSTIAEEITLTRKKHK